MIKGLERLLILLIVTAALLLPVCSNASVLSWGAPGVNVWTAGNPTNLTGVSQIFSTSDAAIKAVVTVGETGGQV